MTFNDPELDRLADELRSLKEKRDGQKVEMEVTFREIQELKDILPPLDVRYREERKTADYWHRRYEKETREWGRGNEDADSSYEEYRRRGAEATNTKAQIDTARGHISELWDKHNAAKTNWRSAGVAYAVVDEQLQARLRRRREQTRPADSRGNRTSSTSPVRASSYIAITCRCKPVRRLTVRPKELQRGSILCGICNHTFNVPERDNLS